MEFQRAFEPNGRGSVWHVTRSMVGGTCSLRRECEFRRVESIMRHQRFDFTGTLTLRDREGRQKLKMSRKEKR